MGEYAEMMLDGTLCAACGVYLGGDGIEGIPNYCRSCGHPESFAVKNEGNKCPLCHRLFKAKGAKKSHLADAHGKKFNHCGELIPITPVGA